MTSTSYTERLTAPASLECAAQQTLLQYTRAVRESFYASEPESDVTRAEYDALYPPSSRQHEWVEAIVQAARRGDRIRAAVLDDLIARCGERVYFSLLHDYPRRAWLPDGYLPPATRKKNAAHRAELRAARQRGRAAGRAAL